MPLTFLSVLSFNGTKLDLDHTLLKCRIIWTKQWCRKSCKLQQHQNIHTWEKREITLCTQSLIRQIHSINYFDDMYTYTDVLVTPIEVRSRNRIAIQNRHLGSKIIQNPYLTPFFTTAVKICFLIWTWFTTQARGNDVHSNTSQLNGRLWSASGTSPFI